MYLVKALFLTLRINIFNILYVLDIFLNTCTGGDRRETVSSRLGKGQVAGKPVHTILAILVNILFLGITFKWNHCIDNIQDFEDEYSFSSIWDKAVSKYKFK